MKKHLIQLVIALLVLFLLNPLAAQSRSSQIELFGGVAFPLAPDFFKDYNKVGASIHGQYVIFPSPNLGISFGVALEGFAFDGDKFVEDLGFSPSDVTVDLSTGIMEIGIGVRPYLTPVTASTQMYVFGMGTYNFLSFSGDITGPGGSEEIDESESKIGVAAGGGLELPAGSSVNILLQGLVRFIFTSDEEAFGGTTTFLGLTAGVAF